MMTCPQCQHNLRDNAIFCDSCGFSIVSFDSPTVQTTLSDMPETLVDYDPLLGAILDSKYEIVERLGQGGVGTVYRARRTNIGDEVAVKVLQQKFVVDAIALERFRREARAAAMLRHPNIVAIYDFGEARGSNAPAFIVMELVEGESIRDILKRESKLELKRAIALMLEVCAGVGAAHRRNIVHRDIKPDNIIVLSVTDDNQYEKAKVVDFGIAKLSGLTNGHTLTQTGALFGTPYYMSPEQCRGEPLDSRADVYSLGAMLYEMLSGVPPFIANNLADLVAQHLHELPPPFPAELNISNELEIIYQRAMSKDPTARQADATIFARELQIFIEEHWRKGKGTFNHTDNRPSLLPTKSTRYLSKLLWISGSFAALLIIGITLFVNIKYLSTTLDVPNTPSNKPETAININSNASNGDSNTKPKTKSVEIMSSDTVEGSQLVFTSDVNLNDYSAYNEGDYFYVKIPQADVKMVQGGGLSGSSFYDAKVEHHDNDVIFSCRRKPNFIATAKQKLNQLIVIFTRK